MKDIIALLTFICLVIVTIYLVTTKQINGKFATVLLVFSVFASFVIVKYDEIKKFKWAGVEVETAKKQLDEYKEKAISEIAENVNEQKQSIKLLMTNANDTVKKVEEQKTVLNGLIETAEKLQKQIKEQSDIAAALQDSTDTAKKEIQELNLASEKTALNLIKATYLTLETKNEFGGQRSTKAIKEIFNDLNQVLPLVVKDESKRAEWVAELKSILPPRQ